MKELIDYQCIDFKKLLLIKGKILKLTDQECYILLLIMTMNEIDMKPINPQSIAKLSSLSVKQIDKILLQLLDKHLIMRKYGKLDLTPVYELLLNNEKGEETKEIDMISIFENAFGRSLNQIELDIIQSFKTQGYDDQMILDALNESVKSGAMSFRYIEKVLDNWSKYGVKKRFAPMNPTPIQTVEAPIKDLKWWDDHE